MRWITALLLLAAAPALSQPSGADSQASCALRAEFSQRDSTTLRARTTEECRHTVSELAATLEQGLAGLPAGTALRSIGLGRLISYPELTDSLKTMAAADTTWDKIKGKGQPNDNAVAARLLHKSPGVAPLRAVIERHGYRLTGVSVEKVLVTASEGSRLPFDAMTWLIVERLP